MLKWGGYKYLVYKTGRNVRLINKAEYCKSIIADGKELITGNESGKLVVPELKDGNVFIIFKYDVTSFKDAFEQCNFLTTIPDNLFADNPKAVNFDNVFGYCMSLTTIPDNLFDGNTEVTNFTGTFQSSDALTGESPYTMIGDKKVHLYERSNYPEHFTTPIEYSNCFYGSDGLSDYAQIPSGWK